jgi:serine protease
LAAAAAASLLAACSSAGTQNIPSTQQQSIVTAPGSHTMSVGSATLHVMFTRDTAAPAFPADPAQRVALAKPASNSNLTYHGGPIQTAPKIYVIFWGSAWNGSGDPDGMASYLVNFLKAAAGSKWLNSVTQYTQSNGQHVGNSGITVSTWTDTGSTPPSRPSQSNLAAEAARGAAHFGDYTASASYIVASPHGIQPQGFVSQYCAWHSSTSTSGGTIAYTNLPYIPDGSWHCGVGAVNNPGTLDGVSIVGGHEQAETETDPQPNTGWLDSSGAENGDKCAWTNLINNPNAGGYPTQPLWSNASSSCVQSY